MKGDRKAVSSFTLTSILALCTLLSAVIVVGQEAMRTEDNVPVASRAAPCLEGGPIQAVDGVGAHRDHSPAPQVLMFQKGLDTGRFRGQTAASEFGSDCLHSRVARVLASRVRVLCNSRWFDGAWGILQRPFSISEELVRSRCDETTGFSY